ncbi:MAG: hypothetical protein ACREWG_14705, partial [Gammaproteobacteria bacterium]
ATRVASLARSLFCLVLPSLLLFITLPWLVRMGWGIYIHRVDGRRLPGNDPGIQKTRHHVVR